MRYADCRSLLFDLVVINILLPRSNLTMPAHLYVEHLVNIGTLSVQASLPSVRNDTTKLAFSADGRELTLWHDGKNTSLRLPTEVPESTRAAPLDLPSDPSKELHIRLPLNGATQNATAEEDTIFVSWSAPSLTDQTEIVCSACQNVLVRRGTISQWKDLPSEGWAEMMEFWHCHKPDVPDDQHVHANDANPATTKGYAAGSQLSVVSGVGLVSPMELAFAKRDVVGVDVSFRLICIAHCFILPFTYILPTLYSGAKEPALPGWLCVGLTVEASGYKRRKSTARVVSASASRKRWKVRLPHRDVYDRDLRDSLGAHRLVHTRED